MSFARLRLPSIPLSPGCCPLLCLLARPHLECQAVWYSFPIRCIITIKRTGSQCDLSLACIFFQKIHTTLCRSDTRYKVATAGKTGDNMADGWQNQGGSSPGDELLQGLEDLKKTFQRFTKGAGVWLIIGVVALLWIGSGFYVVGPSERGIVLRFGAVVAETWLALSSALAR